MNKLTALTLLKLTQFPCEKIAVIGNYNKAIDDVRVALADVGFKPQIVSYTQDRLLMNGGGELLFFRKDQLDLKLRGYRFDKIIIQGSEDELASSDFIEIIYPTLCLPRNFRVIEKIREECQEFSEDMLFNPFKENVFFTESC